MEHYPEDTNDDSRPSNFRACQVCRQRKVKCVAAAEGDSCEYCKKHHVECVQIEPVQKRRRQNTQAELKARVEQLEEKLSQTLNEQARSGQHSFAPSRDETFGAHVNPTSANSQYPPRFRSPSVALSQPSSPYVNHDTNIRPMRRPTSLDHLLATQEQPKYPAAFDMYPSPNINTYSPTLPPPPEPNMSPHMRRSIDSYSLQGSSARFPSNSDRFPQQHPSVPNVRDHYASTLQNSEPHNYANESLNVPAYIIPASQSVQIDNDDETSQKPVFHNSSNANNVDEFMSHRRILGPIPAFDSSFHELCLRRGLATEDDQQCQFGDKFWTRFYRLSNDPALKLYQLSFTNQSLIQSGFDDKPELPPDTVAQVRTWTEVHGDCLLETLKLKIFPRYQGKFGQIKMDSKEDLLLQPRELTTVCLASLRILFLLADFNGGMGIALLDSWVLSHAFELRLNIDPEHWQIPEWEKHTRRQMFWLIMVNDRFSAMQRNAPSVEPDHYDTKLPESTTLMGEIRVFEIEISAIVAKISRNFFSVRGARLVHSNAAMSSTISVQLEEMVVELKTRQLSRFPEFEKMADLTAGFTVAISQLNLELGIILIHRPFFSSSSLNLIESLEHHRKAISAAVECVNILHRMQDSYFTESWPTHSRHLLATVVITLLQESLLSPDAHLRVNAKRGLDIYMDILNRQSQRWILCRFCFSMMRLATALSDETYGVQPEQSDDASTQNTTSIEPKDCQEGSPWSNNEWERLAAFEWDDLSQMFGVNNLANEWFMASK